MARDTKTGRRVQAEHNEIRCGYRPPPDKADQSAQRPFVEVAEEYFRWGESQGGRGGRPWGRGHARMRRSLLTWWQEKLGLSVLADLNSILPAAEQALQELQAKGRSGKTLTGYVDSLVAFCRWCATKSRGYLKENPLEGISRFDTTPRTRRCAMTAEEIQKFCLSRRNIVDCCTRSPSVRDSANELRSLSVEHLDRERGGLHLDSDWTKDRKAAFSLCLARWWIDSQPLQNRKPPRHSILVILVEMTPGSNLFPKDHSFTCQLNRPGRWKTTSGRRHPKAATAGETGFSRMSRGLHQLRSFRRRQRPRAQSLRHATPDMTMNVYGRTEDTRLAELVERVGQTVLYAGQEKDVTTTEVSKADVVSTCSQETCDTSVSASIPAASTDALSMPESATSGEKTRHNPPPSCGFGVSGFSSFQRPLGVTRASSSPLGTREMLQICSNFSRSRALACSSNPT